MRRVFAVSTAGLKGPDFLSGEDIFREICLGSTRYTVPVVQPVPGTSENVVRTHHLYIYTVFTSVPVTSTTGVFLTVRCVLYLYTHIFQQYVN